MSAGKHEVILTEMSFFTSSYVFTSGSEKGVGDGHSGNLLGFYIIAHFTVNMGLPPLGISQQLFFFFSPDFGAVQKDFTVSEEVCPPTLSPVFLSVSLSTTLASVEHILIITQILSTVYLKVLDSRLLYGLLFLMV